MLKKILSITILIAVLWCTCIQAQNVWRSSFPPMSIDLDKAILDAFAAKFGATVEGSKVPFARRLQQLKTGEIDLLAGLLKDNTREEYAYFLSSPYKRKTNKIFIMRAGEGSKLREYEDLYHLRVSVQVGAKYFPLFDQDVNIKKHASTNDESRLQMLLKDRFDTIIHTELYGTKLVYNSGLQDQVEIAPYRYSEINPVFIAVSKKSDLYKDISELDRVLSTMVESGEMYEVIDNYFRDIKLPIPDYK